MSTSEKNKKIVWARVKGQCAICSKELLHDADDENFSLLGEVAHIVGEQQYAPRGNHSMPLEVKMGTSYFFIGYQKV